MVLYKCEICKFSSNIKTHFQRHLKTKKHINNVNSTSINSYKEVRYQNDPKMTQNDPKMTQNDPPMTQNDQWPKWPNDFGSFNISENQLNCEFCGKLFSTKAHRRRHELHRCKKYNTYKQMYEKGEKDKENCMITLTNC